MYILHSKVLYFLCSFIVATGARPLSSLSSRSCEKVSPSWLSQIYSADPNHSYPNALGRNGGSFFIFENSTTSDLEYLSFTIPPTTNTSSTCTLSATFPYFESQYISYPPPLDSPPTIDVFLAPSSPNPFTPTWTSVSSVFTSTAPFGSFTPAFGLSTTINSIPCPKDGNLAFAFKFASGVVGSKSVYDNWPQYPEGNIGGYPMTGVYLEVC
ncbi:hypothetical protein ACMFMF_008054 [Clarireedia jacksonii]